MITTPSEAIEVIRRVAEGFRNEDGQLGDIEDLIEAAEFMIDAYEDRGYEIQEAMEKR